MAPGSLPTSARRRTAIQSKDLTVLRDGPIASFTQWDVLLNDLGADGWELVTVLGGTGDAPKQFVFKRPR